MAFAWAAVRLAAQRFRIASARRFRTAAENRRVVACFFTGAAERREAASLHVGSGYWLRLPMSGWYTAEGKPVEGHGVLPDIPVDVDPFLLNNGIDQQLNKAIEIVTGVNALA